MLDPTAEEEDCYCILLVDPPGQGTMTRTWRHREKLVLSAAEVSSRKSLCDELMICWGRAR